jgi:hypothetical protein
MDVDGFCFCFLFAFLGSRTLNSREILERKEIARAAPLGRDRAMYSCKFKKFAHWGGLAPGSSSGSGRRAGGPPRNSPTQGVVPTAGMSSSSESSLSLKCGATVFTAV